MSAPQGESPVKRAFEEWLARTGGLSAPNDAERFGMIAEDAMAGNSFPGSDMLWVINYLNTCWERLHGD